ncbi:Gfo/Idh/MocA family protein [Pseudactinotalea sp. Z1748]|uniref:Gfo/Idh/MocA family protein n=1 Tax=Pseudactinotalea sp. Z1748 TaxID=3413027 RepID=UPI003C7D8DBB
MNTSIPATGEALRIAIVGCGVIGTLHAEVAAASPDLHVVAVVDPIAERTEKLAHLLTRSESRAASQAPRRYAHLDEALAHGGLDVVAVCTPSGTHAALAGQALEAGLHVVVEKPLDADLPAARALHAAAATRPEQVVSVISQHRHDPSAMAIHEAIERGRLGRVTSAAANVDWYRKQAYYDSGDWRGTWSQDGGGALANQGIHTLDLLLWFLGEPLEVFAYTARLGHERIEVEDVAVAVIRFTSGALATVHASTTVYPDLGVRLGIHGTDGSAVIEGDLLSYFHARDAEGATWVANQVGAQEDENKNVLGGFDPAGSHTSQYGDSHALQWADVVRAIRSGGQPWVGLDHGLNALATVRAIYLSATLGQPIRVAEVLAGDYDGVPVRTGQVPEASQTSG